MSNLKLGNHTISRDNYPFTIAEMSGNHNQSIERALALVDAAAESGVHAIKLQTYTPDTMTIDYDQGLFKIEDPNSLWDGNTLYELYEKAHTPWDWHERIYNRAREKGLVPFSTPFDLTAVDFLEELGTEFYKIASFENKDWELLKRVAQTRKPVIMSTGATTLSDLSDSVAILKENGCKDLVLLQCTSTYPATPENSNLATIPIIKEIFNCEVGLSDHTLGIGASIASIALGARVIEKHFTISRNEGGVDAAFSMEPTEMKSLVIESRRAFESLGKVKFDILEDEKSSLRFKRSIYVVDDIDRGEEFTRENIRVIRPGDGLEPKYFGQLLGKKCREKLNKGTPLSWDLI